MNKKVLSIVLGIVVLLIWVKVFSKIFDQFGDDEYATVEAPSMDIIDLSKYIKKDTIPTLKLDYRDPFLGKAYQPRKVNNSPQNSNVNKTPPQSNDHRNNEILVEKWPQISYHGFVKVIGSKQGTVLLKVGGQMHKIREGEVINDELIISKAYRDSIVIVRNEEAKTFYK